VYDYAGDGGNRHTHEWVGGRGESCGKGSMDCICEYGGSRPCRGKLDASGGWSDMARWLVGYRSNVKMMDTGPSSTGWGIHASCTHFGNRDGFGSLYTSYTHIQYTKFTLLLSIEAMSRILWSTSRKSMLILGLVPWPRLS
jgi:hypothetical protein